MKKISRHIFIILLSISFSIQVFAHPGRTDSDGGHTNHSTGEYHYHHGFPEHNHPDDICPYVIQDPDDPTYKPSYNDSNYAVIRDDADEHDTEENKKTINPISWLWNLGFESKFEYCHPAHMVEMVPRFC